MKEDIRNGAIRVLTAYGPMRMLGDTRLAPYARVATMIEMCFLGESEESFSLRGLIEDAQADFRDSHECRQLRREADARAAYHARG